MLEKYFTKNKKHSPLKNDPLRHPGQSLNEKINDIIFDKVIYYLFIILIFFIVTLLEWIRAYAHVPPHPIFWTVVTVFIIIYFIFKIKKSLTIVNNLKLGRDGEVIVGESLDVLREKGYKVYHDIIDESSDGKTFNIDHVIVGPAGVFTIETKTIRKSKGNPVVTYNGINVKVDGFAPDRDPIKQAKNQKYWLENFIESNVKLKLNVKPVVLYPGWYIIQRFVDAEVWVLNQKAFPSYLEKHEITLRPEQVNLIAGHIESYIRTDKN